MAGDEGVTGPVPIDQMDPMDRAAMAQAQGHQYIDNMSTFFGSAPSPTTQGQDAQAINAVQDRANAKQQLAQAQSAGTSMQVDPEHVDKLAAFFEGEARELRQRQGDVYTLATVSAPGTDPVSTGAAAIYGNVAAGDDQAYLTNYLKLADVFDATAASLRDSATQTRTSDQNAADGFGGDVRA